jgi:glycosyltransferase involved in cell wall biosynthesis
MTPDAERLRAAFGRPALVHDWLTVPGGSEQVAMHLLDLLPEAEVFTSVYDRATWEPRLGGRPVHPSFLNRIPGAVRQYPKLLPLMNAAFESFDLSGFDLVVSSSHSCAKNVVTPAETRHVCYCHTPMRHAWEPRFLAGERIGALGRLAAGPLLGHLRRVDLAGAARPDVFVANSAHVKARIEKYYRRDARVVHPPVDVEAHAGRPRRPEDYYLVLGRVVPYKRVDLAVAACALLGRPVRVAGTGRALREARAAAGPGARFEGYVPQERVHELLAGARALLFCAEEDFGIVPVEAQAAGVPVIAYRRGGAQDSVIEGETGVFHAEQTVASVASAILEFEQASFDEDVLRENARRFGAARFASDMTQVILDAAAVRDAA